MSNLTDFFSALPGTEVPVGGISKGLAQMWTDTGEPGEATFGPDDAKATQVNFVLHLGMNTAPEDALAQFQTAVRFSQRYPSRVVILCPQRGRDGPNELRAKVYGECFLGKSKADKRCVEFVILSYPREAREHLENQVSICLSTDLPLYYWVHRFSTIARVGDYRYLTARANRIIMDSADAPADAGTFVWPRPEAVRDLVLARLLPVRQSLGQFLSRYPEAVLADGLQTVALAHGPALEPEGRVLLGWLRDRLARCGAGPAAYTLAALPAGDAGSFALTFGYAAGKSFRWSGDLAKHHALFEADFGTGRTTLPAPISLLPPEMALSEAMFF
jgi:hypothetical protein